MRGNQGISRLTSYYRCVSGYFRLSIGDMLICKFDTGGFKKGNFRTFPQGKYQVKYQSFLRLPTNDSIDRHDHGSNAESCSQQASGLRKL